MVVVAVVVVDMRAAYVLPFVCWCVAQKGESGFRYLLLVVGAAVGAAVGGSVVFVAVVVVDGTLNVVVAGAIVCRAALDESVLADCVVAVIVY